MAFDWEKYLDLADELSKRTDDEAALRSAVSRAYYAVFGKAQIYLRSQGIDVSPLIPKFHQKVWDEFTRLGGRTRQSIGRNGDRLRLDRNKADYEGTVNNLT